MAESRASLAESRASLAESVISRPESVVSVIEQKMPYKRTEVVITPPPPPVEQLLMSNMAHHGPHTKYSHHPQLPAGAEFFPRAISCTQATQSDSINSIASAS